MSRFYFPGLVLGGWTLLLWSTRINNVLDDAGLEGWSRTWQLGISVLFVVVATVLVGSSLVRGNSIARMVSDRLGVVLAVFGSLWWLVRGINTLLADHGVGFKVVHTLLALGTIAISGWLLRGSADRSNARFVKIGASPRSSAK